MSSSSSSDTFSSNSWYLDDIPERLEEEIKKAEEELEELRYRLRRAIRRQTREFSYRNPWTEGAPVEIRDFNYGLGYRITRITRAKIYVKKPTGGKELSFTKEQLRIVRRTEPYYIRVPDWEHPNNGY